MTDNLGKGLENYIESYKRNFSGNMIVPKIGDMVIAKVESVTANTFKCKAICKVGFNQFFEISSNKPFFN